MNKISFILNELQPAIKKEENFEIISNNAIIAWMK